MVVVSVSSLVVTEGVSPPSSAFEVLSASSFSPSEPSLFVSSEVFDVVVAEVVVVVADDVVSPSALDEVEVWLCSELPLQATSMQNIAARSRTKMNKCLLDFIGILRNKYCLLQNIADKP